MLSQLEDKLFIIRNKRYWLMETKEIVEWYYKTEAWLQLPSSNLFLPPPPKKA